MKWRGLYVLGWLLYMCVNAIVITVAGAPARVTAIFTVANSLPPALLGVLVVRYYSSAHPAERWWIVVRNVVFAIGFGVVSLLGTVALAWIIERGEFKFRIEAGVWGLLIDELLFVILASVARLHRMQTDLTRERERAAAAEALRARAELAALRARIDPHFLFNTLHSLLALVRQDPGRAEEAIEQFADILRYTFAAGEGGEERTLQQEWELVDNYLALERLRLGERLRVTQSLSPDVAQIPLPVLTLQPLVENAIRHAIAPRAAGGRVDIRAERSDGVVRISVSDDGPGANIQALSRGNGRGLQLVRDRLDRMYRGAATMTLSRAAEGGFRVTIDVPISEA